MLGQNLRQPAAIGLLSLGLLCPQLARAEQAAPDEPAPPPTASPAATAAVPDVALLAGGVLQGQVVTPAGQPLVGVPVLLQWGGQTIACVPTDAGGRFSVPGLRGGLCQISTAGGVGVYRLWMAGTEPPEAHGGVLAVANTPTVRGQSRKRHWLAPAVIAGALGSILPARPTPAGGT